VEKSIADAVKNITEKYQKELDELRAELQDLKAINQILHNIQQKQDEMDRQTQTKSTNLEAKVEKLLAILEEQNVPHIPADQDFTRPRKKTLKGRQFSTPEKLSPTINDNRYSALSDNEQHDNDHMDEEHEDNVDNTNSWDENDPDSRHPITLLQTQDPHPTFDHTEPNQQDNFPCSQATSKINPYKPSASVQRLRGRGFGRDHQ
jgi:hypothetical protein